MNPTPDETSISRRHLLAGIGLASTGGLLAALPGGSAVAASGAPGQPDALSATLSGLTNLAIDELSFFPASQTGTRYIDSLSGVGLTASGWLAAALPVPAGSLIRQIDVAYQGTPLMRVLKRPFSTPADADTTAYVQGSLPAGGGPKTASLTSDLPPRLEPAASYSLQLYCSPGDSVYAAAVAYEPPVQGFVPFTGAEPRVYDSRSGPRLAPGEERTIALGNPGARGAVINLTLTQTSGSSGYVAVFPANVSWPGNSSQNWFAPNANVANTVISAVDPYCQVKARGGENPTHVIIDRIGWLV